VGWGAMCLQVAPLMQTVVRSMHANVGIGSAIRLAYYIAATDWVTSALCRALQLGWGRVYSNVTVSKVT
jgi:hypothetical protein